MTLENIVEVTSLVVRSHGDTELDRACSSLDWRNGGVGESILTTLRLDIGEVRVAPYAEGNAAHARQVCPSNSVDIVRGAWIRLRWPSGPEGFGFCRSGDEFSEDDGGVGCGGRQSGCKHRSEEDEDSGLHGSIDISKYKRSLVLAGEGFVDRSTS